jgi:hypothetical protein
MQGNSFNNLKVIVTSGRRETKKGKVSMERTFLLYIVPFKHSSLQSSLFNPFVRPIQVSLPTPSDINTAVICHNKDHLTLRCNCSLKLIIIII